MEKTIEHQIKTEQMEAVARSTKGMPIGQRVRAVGYKVITSEQLSERFACKAIEDAQNAAIKAKLISDFCGKEGKTWADLETEGYALQDHNSSYAITFETPEEKVERETKEAQRKTKGISFFSLMTFDMIPRNHKASARKKNCIVRMEKLDEYLEEIPPRVMDSLKVARMCGLSKFAVAYPVLEDAPQPDPVLVAHLGDKLIEIDMWE